jgi:uncharacterized membrane protein YvbJ
MFCKNCGSQLPDNSTFCGNCGAKTAVYNTQVVQVPNENAPKYNNTAKNVTDPLSVKNYLGMFFLLLIPIVNIILLFVWAFDSSANINKSNFAKAYLIYMLILIIFSIILSLIFGSIIAAIFSNISSEYYY